MRFIQQIQRDERGTAAVEFAFLLPMMLMLLVGVIEVTNLLRLDRKVVTAAQTAADLVSQRREVSHAELDDFMRATELVIEPFPSSALTIGLAGVRYDVNSGDPEVAWTKNRNGGGVPNALLVAEGLGDKGEGVVVVHLTYNYTPTFFAFLLGKLELEETAVLRPRRSRQIEGPDS